LGVDALEESALGVTIEAYGGTPFLQGVRAAASAFGCVSEGVTVLKALDHLRDSSGSIIRISDRAVEGALYFLASGASEKLPAADLRALFSKMLAVEKLESAVTLFEMIVRPPAPVTSVQGMASLFKAAADSEGS
jgi:hypothetical protein